MSGQAILDESEQSGDTSGDIEDTPKAPKPDTISIENNNSLAQALEPAATPITTSQTTIESTQTVPTTLPLTTLPTAPSASKKKKKAKKSKKSKNKHFNVAKTDKHYLKFLGAKVSCKISKQKPSKKGVLRWVGYLSNFPHKIIAGVELDDFDRLGTNGSYQAKRYFITKPGYGYFFQLKQCRKISKVHG